jgi:acyl carrier protein
MRASLVACTLNNNKQNGGNKMIFEKIAAILAEYKDMDPSEITMETTFEGLGLDSLDTVDLVMSFEEQLGVSIEMDESLKSVGDVVALIEKNKA